MRCPRCKFEGELLEGGCMRCGYGRGRVASYPLPLLNRGTTNSGPIALVSQSLLRSDILRQGRYQLLEQLVLPRNQQGQGKAWLAKDMRRPDKLAVVREVFPTESSSSAAEQSIRAIALSMAHLGQYPGFPSVIDMFSERGFYYIVLEHIEGKSLAQILQQSGSLPERTVAEYGRQLCSMLQVLASQQPPIVHGSINPDTVIISPDRRRASLIHLPLSTPTRLPASNGKALSGYMAPEQVRGNMEPATDIYGLAGTLHHALTEYDPDKHMSFFFPPARRLNPAVTPRMEAFLSRALRLSLAQRYVRPADMQRDFETLLASYPNTEALSDVDSMLANRPNLVRRREERNSSLMVSLFAIVSVMVSILLLGGILLAVVRGPTLNTSVNATATASAMRAAAAAHQAQLNAAMQSELQLESQSFARKGIGISDGRFIFDSYDPKPVVGDNAACKNSVDCKDQAAKIIQQNGNLNTAANLLTMAINANPTDAEARIYNEDVGILQNNLPYVTIMLGIGMNNDTDTLTSVRNTLQAAFVAQYEINEFALLPHGLQLRVLIADSGSSSADVTTLSQFVVSRITKAGNPDHILAVVGWSSSIPTINARDILASVHVPLVSQTASDVRLSGSSPYFFRVNPPFDVQGNALGTIAVQQLHAQTILVMRDPNDPDSVSLANTFIVHMQALNVPTVDNTKGNFSEMTTFVTEYQPVIDEVISSKADVIFLAGSDIDAVRLAHAVGIASRNDPTNTLLAHLKILGGTALDSNLLVGQGSGVDALIARKYPQDMQRLNFIAFADFNELAFLKIPPQQQSTFFTEWSGLYQNSVGADAIFNAPPPDQYALTTYDAMEIIGKAVTLVQGSLTGQAVRDALRSFGTQKVPAFHGVSGRIMFDAQGNPIDKAIFILDVEGTGGNNSIVLKQILGTF